MVLLLLLLVEGLALALEVMLVGVLGLVMFEVPELFVVGVRPRGELCCSQFCSSNMRLVVSLLSELRTAELLHFVRS